MEAREGIKRTLEEGVQNGEWFDIVYHGGSNPGARRKIAPISISGNKVRARCYTSNAVKLFTLEKIEILVDGGAIEAIAEWRRDATPRDFPGVADVRDVYLLYSDTLRAKGWRVELVESDEGWGLGLFGYFKNGKPKKRPTLVISYEHTKYDHSYVYDPEPIPVKINPQPRARPWTYGGTFAKSYGPVMRFLMDAGLSEDEIKSRYP